MLGDAVTNDTEAGLPKLPGYGPRCPTCAGPSRLIMTMLDTKTGKPIRLYKCQKCGQRVWDDNRNSGDTFLGRKTQEPFPKEDE
jgi:uncharacterized protein YlaI